MNALYRDALSGSSLDCMYNSASVCVVSGNGSRRGGVEWIPVSRDPAGCKHDEHLTFLSAIDLRRSLCVRVCARVCLFLCVIRATRMFGQNSDYGGGGLHQPGHVLRSDRSKVLHGKHSENINFEHVCFVRFCWRFFRGVVFIFCLLPLLFFGAFSVASRRPC